MISSIFGLVMLGSVHGRLQGVGTSRRSPPPPDGKSRKLFFPLYGGGGFLLPFHHVRSLFARFFSLWGPFPPFGGLFATFFSIWGLFAMFSPCEGLFAIIFSMWRAFFVFIEGPLWTCPPPPLRKLLRGPMAQCHSFTSISCALYKSYY